MNPLRGVPFSQLEGELPPLSHLLLPAGWLCPLGLRKTRVIGSLFLLLWSPSFLLSFYTLFTNTYYSLISNLKVLQAYSPSGSGLSSSLAAPWSLQVHFSSSEHWTMSSISPRATASCAMCLAPHIALTITHNMAKGPGRCLLFCFTIECPCRPGLWVV